MGAAWIDRGRMSESHGVGRGARMAASGCDDVDVRIGPASLTKDPKRKKKRPVKVV